MKRDGQNNIDAIVAEAQTELADAPAQTIVCWAYDTFSPRFGLSCSFGGVGGLILAHMAYTSGRPVPIIFGDTHFLFPETYELKRHLERTWGLEVIVAQPEMTPEQQTSQYGDDLWRSDPDLCCHMRKVRPMAAALKRFDCWMTGLRRDQSESRRHIELIQKHTLFNGHELLKLNPLAHWTKKDVWKYMKDQNIPYNPLIDQGFLSIGCIQCTARSVPGDERSGRWKGSAKTECGLHTTMIQKGNG